MKPDGIGCLVFGADLDGWNSVLEPLVNEGRRSRPRGPSSRNEKAVSGPGILR